MRSRARFITTAGTTILGFAAMSGVAQADPISDLTGGLTGTVGGVVDSVTGAIDTGGSASTGQTTNTTKAAKTDTDPAINLRVNGPVHLSTNVSAKSSAENGTSVNASVRAGVGSGRGQRDLVDTSLSVNVCGSLPECGAPPSTSPPTPTPPTPTPPGPGPGSPAGPHHGAGPPGSATSETITADKSLPFTGGPLGALTGLGAAAVLTGAAAIAGSRFRVRRDP